MKHENCNICKNYHDFEIDKYLLHAIHSGDSVFFVGSGVSTESKKFFPFTFYEDIKMELEIPKDDDISFSKLMSIYCEKNGGKPQLINKIKKRLEYAESFPELYGGVTRFHTKLATIPMINDIITTNWDDYFEKECAATPFVTDEDMVFWDNAKRRVLKIHGSINNLGSIVATEEDYKQCYKNLSKNSIGGQLRSFLARKTLVFIGYSFRDEDFHKIYNFINKQMGTLIKQRYIVTLSKENDDKWKKLKLKPIYTDGEYFLDNIRDILEKECRLLPLEVVPKLFLDCQEIKEQHSMTSTFLEDNVLPEIIYCLSYQDGLIHAYEYFLNKLESGYSYQLINFYDSLRAYEKIKKDLKKQKKWFDYAYINGYLMGIMSMLISAEKKNKKIPYFYNIFKDDVYTTPKQFINSFSKKSRGNKSIIADFNKILERGDIGNEMVVHHTCFLL